MRLFAALLIAAALAVAQVPQPTSGSNSGGSGSPSSGAADTPQCADGSGGFTACPAGAYSADVGSGTTWTITNATHEMDTCDVSITAQTESAGVRSWVVPQAWTCAESDYEINITWSTATAGRVVIMKGGGGGGGGGGAPTDAPYWLSTSNGTLSAEVNLGALADNSVVAVDVTAGTATPRAALYSDITPLWDSGSCGTDYMRGNGTCDTPSGSLPALGTAYQILRVNSGASASEWATLGAGAGVSVTPSAGTTTISVDSTQVPLLALDNAFLGDNSFAGTTTNTPSSAQTLVAGDAVTVTASTVKRISTAGAVTSTATPTIADGADGQLVYIHNSGANDWTMQDESGLAGSNLCLPSGSSVTLNPGDTVAMVFISASSCWSKLK